MLSSTAALRTYLIHRRGTEIVTVLIAWRDWSSLVLLCSKNALQSVHHVGIRDHRCWLGGVFLFHVEVKLGLVSVDSLKHVRRRSKQDRRKSGYNWQEENKESSVGYHDGSRSRQEHRSG